MPESTPWPQIVDQLPIGLLILDADRVIRAWNLWLAQRTGVEATAARGRTFADLFEGFDDPPFEKAFRDVLETGTPRRLSRALDHYLLPIAAGRRARSKRELMEQRVELARVQAAGGEHQVMVVITDVTEMVMRTENLFQMLRSFRRRSNTDPLTGLYNRRFMSDWMDHAIKLSTRTGSPLSVVMMDIDAFKRINDTHGHLVGDAVIRDLAAEIRAQVRESDVVVRYGGEEFAILLPNCRLDQAIPRAQDVLNAIRGAALGGLAPGMVTSSAGVASFDPAAPCGVSDLLSQADKFLYDAKRAGGKIVLPRHSVSQQE